MANPGNKEFYVATRDEVEELSWQTAERIIREGKNYQQVLGVARGGLFLAFYLAKALDIQDVQTIRAFSYVPSGDGVTETALEEPDLMDLPYLRDPEGDGALIAEDLVDTGGTLRLLNPLLPGADVAVNYSKLPEPETAELAQYCGKIILPQNPENEVWIDFWYDIEKRRRFPKPEEI